MGRRLNPDSPANVKRAVRTRDGHRCKHCGISDADSRAAYGRGLEVHRLEPGSAYTLAGCVLLCPKCHGSQPKLPRGGRLLAALRLPGDMASMVRVVALARGISHSAYLCDLLSRVLSSCPQLDQDYAQALKHLGRFLVHEEPPPPQQPREG